MIAPYYTPEQLVSTATQLARRYSGRHDAEDISQESVYHYVRAIYAGCTTRDAGAYLARIVQRCATDRGRADRRQPIAVELREDDTAVRAGGLAPAPEHTVDVDQRLDVEALLPRLPRKERQAVRHVLHGQPLEVLAQADGVSLGTVRRRLQRGVRHLREMLEGSA